MLLGRVNMVRNVILGYCLPSPLKLKSTIKRLIAVKNYLGNDRQKLVSTRRKILILFPDVLVDMKSRYGQMVTYGCFLPQIMKLPIKALRSVHKQVCLHFSALSHKCNICCAQATSNQKESAQCHQLA